MSPRKKSKPEPENLRQKVKGSLQSTGEQIQNTSQDEIRQLVHELRVHQMELEMQNEELREAYQKLEVARDRHAALFDSSPVGYLLIDEKGQILEANLRFCDMVGATRKNLLHQTFISFFEPDDQVAFRRHLQDLTTSGGPQTSEVLTLRCVDTPLRVRLESCLDTMPISNQATLVRTAVINVTEQEQAQDALRKSHSLLELQKIELQSLTERLFKVQEEERERIARELHDDINQRLAVLGLKIHEVQQNVPRNALAASKLNELLEDVGTLSDDVRKLAYQFHPSNLQDLGLESSMKCLVENLTNLNHLPITLRIHDFPRKLPSEVATCIYRIAQESFHNIMKHARATSVQCELGGENNGVSLVIQDNGVGFSMSEHASQGLGLVSLKERVRVLKGRLAIESATGKGTKIQLWIPITGKSGHLSSNPDIEN